MNDQLSRRTVLGVTSGAIATGLAGCLTGNDQQENNDGQNSDAAGQTDEEDGHDDSHEEDDHGSHTEDLNGPSAEAEVAMTTTDSGDHFEPHVVWVESGGSVNWTNKSGSHSTTAYHPENDEPQLVPDETAAWDSGVLSEPEATFDRAFETEGVYHYYCTPHETAGMIGSIIVGHPDLEAQPALEEPPSEKSDAVREKLTGLNETVRGTLNGDNTDDDNHADNDSHANDDGHDDHNH
ncbi:plastocyanin/azurin family copper-binding protein [Natrinema sp. SYSU A 869]|uniref:cupredoxin domain-containing protein n=1 Tax=Natrinema sp. SYSU A 869 TaxID=2871694 RepID=UPI001CA42735|nr:plastocyanin/azurin family copper-binding protein [Natrinema sp. SYSU A 869]